MKKIISIVLVLLMTLSFAVSVSAQEEVSWTLSDDGKILSDGTNEYMLYSEFSMEHFSPAEAYVFEEAVMDEELVDYDVAVPKANKDIVCLAESDNWFESSVYVTVEGKKELDAFQNGMYGCARIFNYMVWNGGYGELKLDFLEKLDSFKGEVVLMNVRDLEDLDVCPVYVYDVTDTIEHKHGDIYIDGDVYYYINYDALDNSYFDADGYFSYRKGTVSVLKLDSEAISVLNVVSGKLEDKFTDYEYVGSDEVDFDFNVDGEIFDKQTAVVIFWALSGFFGFAVPLAIGIFGIIFALSKKPGKNKKWLALPVLSLLWMMVFAAIILVLII